MIHCVTNNVMWNASNAWERKIEQIFPISMLICLTTWQTSFRAGIFLLKRKSRTSKGRTNQIKYKSIVQRFVENGIFVLVLRTDAAAAAAKQTHISFCFNSFHRCDVMYSWMLIKTFDIYIFQKRWQTPRISRSYSGIILSFACCRACTFVKLYFSLFFHSHVSVHFNRPLAIGHCGVWWRWSWSWTRVVFYSTLISRFDICYCIASIFEWSFSLPGQ